MSDIKVGDIVEVSDGGELGNFSGLGRVVGFKRLFVRVAPLEPEHGAWSELFDFHRDRVTLVASVTAEGEEPEVLSALGVPLDGSHPGDALLGLSTADETSKSYHFFEAILDANDAHPSSKAFYNELIDCGLLHAQKQRDYGKPGDPFANVRSTEEWGLPGWVGAMVRLNDKVKRLQALARTGGLANESAIDSFRDIAVYALIALVLYQQEGAEAGA